MKVLLIDTNFNFSTVYNRVLSNSEILQNYNATKYRFSDLSANYTPKKKEGLYAIS